MTILEDWRFNSGHENYRETELESKKEGQENIQLEPEQEQIRSDSTKEKEKNDGSS